VAAAVALASLKKKIYASNTFFLSIYYYQNSEKKKILCFNKKDVEAFFRLGRDFVSVTKSRGMAAVFFC
jgi:hypothetical protein